MARLFQPSTKLVKFATKLSSTTDDLKEYKKSLTIILSARYGLTSSEISEIINTDERTLYRYRDEMKTLCKGGIINKGQWGGRRQELMSPKEESLFLEQYIPKALEGEILNVSAIQTSLIDYLNRNVGLSTVYDMLHRNGWRKLRPDNKHPKSDPIVQQEFKKKCQK
jgi:transposase